MKKLIKTIFTFSVLPLLFACQSRHSAKKQEELSDSFKLVAIVTDVSDDRIEAEVVESDYAYGVYWVLTPKQTKYLDKTDGQIARRSISKGDRVEIFYGGQVMMSYPPQIVAARIKVIN